VLTRKDVRTFIRILTESKGAEQGREKEINMIIVENILITIDNNIM
jgi:hypothetical protein